MLTEAWLEVEAQRRKAAQGVRAGHNAGSGRVVRPLGAAPVVGPAVVVDPVKMSNASEPVTGAPEDVASADSSANLGNPIDAAALNTGANPGGAVAAQGPIPNSPVMPLTASPIDSVTNIPVNTSASLSAAEQAAECDARQRSCKP